MVSDLHKKAPSDRPNIETAQTQTYIYSPRTPAAVGSDTCQLSVPEARFIIQVRGRREGALTALKHHSSRHMWTRCRSHFYSNDHRCHQLRWQAGKLKDHESVLRTDEGLYSFFPLDYFLKPQKKRTAFVEDICSLTHPDAVVASRRKPMAIRFH